VNTDSAQPLDSLDLTTPNVARMYDYYLGGFHNFAADRAAAQRILEIFPDTPAAAQTNRHFLRRAVRHLVEQEGVRQFLDIGAGLPTQGNVHEITADAGARVVYVDNDPVAVAHARQLLTGVEAATVVLADLRRPDELLAHPEVRSAVDFSRPVAILLVSVLHFVPDDADPWAAVARLREATSPGSFLALSHLTLDGAPPGGAQRGEAVYRQASAPLVPRTRDGIARFFDGYDLLDPGLVWLGQWRPDDRPEDVPPAVSHGYGAVGRRR
jgi:SAM-dependent methyltransferase